MLTRKQFFGSVAGLFGIAMLSACGEEGVENPGPDAAGPRPDGSGPLPDASNPPTDAPVQACTTAAAAIGSNHGHSLTVPNADVEAGVNKTYNIQGGSDHPHMVLLTAANFATLKASRTLTVTSTNGSGHTHSVTVTC